MLRTDRLFLGFAYILLVVIVAGMGWWVEKEFDEAREERCSLARAELLLGSIQALALERAAPVDFRDDVARAIVRAAEEIQGVCDIRIEPAELFEALTEGLEPTPTAP